MSGGVINVQDVGVEGELRMKKAFKIVKIQWRDAVRHHEIRAAEDIDTYEPIPTTTIGMLLKETDEYYIVAQTYFEPLPNFDGAWNAVMIIPRGMAEGYSFLTSVTVNMEDDS